MPESIAVEGLDELRRSLKIAGGIEATREFKTAGYAAAAEVVIPRAKARAAGLGKMQAKAADTLRPANTVTGGAVRFGRGFPASMGAEFGAQRNQPRGTVGKRRMTGWNQFEPWKGNGIEAGYFVWPTIRDDAAAITARFNAGLSPLLQRLFPQNY